MREVADGVYQLGTSWVNFFLVVEDVGLTFIDTGFPSYVPMARNALGRLGRTHADVKAIVLTHTHIDHIGGARKLAEETDAPVLVHKIEAGIATGSDRPVIPKSFITNMWRPNALALVAHAATNGGAKRITVRDVTTYDSDEMLDVPGKPRVVFTPGHSAGHSSILLEERKVLFAGDAMSMRSLYTGKTGPMLHPVNEDPRQARASLTKLEGTPAEIVLPGHGEPFLGSPATAMRAARRAS